MSDEFRWWSATQIASAIRSRQVSASEVLEATIARIERLDPQLGAVVIPLFERVRARALKGAGTATPIFRGVPMLLKDAGEELEGTPNWVGTQGLRKADYHSTETTALAGSFERIGFTIVGKSACPELSASSTTEPFGFAPTRNPWALDRSAGGSSGGSAAAVAAGLVPIAHGSDGSGSLRFPASHCGVVTLKPTRGRIPITPPTGQTDPLRAWTQFALARDVNDLATLFPLLASDQPSRRDHAVKFRVGLLDHDPIVGLPVAPECADAVRAFGRAMTLFGHNVDVSHPDALDTLFAPYWKAMATIAPTIRLDQVNWLSKRLGRPCTTGDLTDAILALAERGRAVKQDDLRAAYQTVRDAISPITNWWNDGFDLLATPVTLEPAWHLGEDAPRKTGMFGAPFSFTGQPALVVPIGMSAAGLPVGVQIVGRHGDDELLLDLGAQLQAAFGWLDRRPPID